MPCSIYNGTYINNIIQMIPMFPNVINKTITQMFNLEVYIMVHISPKCLILNGIFCVVNMLIRKSTHLSTNTQVQHAI